MFRKAIRLVSLIAFDVAALFSALFLAYLIRKEILLYVHPAFRMWTFPFSTYLVNYPYFIGLWVIILAYERLYTKRFVLGEEIKRLWKGASCSFLIIMVLTFAARISMNVSRTVIILSWALSLFLLPTFRLLAKKILNKAGCWQRNILILGAGRTGRMVLERVKKNKNMGYKPVGFLDDDEAKLGRTIGGVKVLGKLSEIKNWVKEKKVGDVVIAMPGVSREKLLEVVSLCEGVVDEIRVIPDVFGLATVGVKAEDLDELPQLVNVFQGKMSLVGPRPYLPRELEKMGEYRKTILKALPGMAGLWQVSGKNELTFEDRLRLEEYYVRNWSLWLDFVILLKTVRVVLRGEGI